MGVSEGSAEAEQQMSGGAHTWPLLLGHQGFKLGPFNGLNIQQGLGQYRFTSSQLCDFS
jgi:hypothetical protein